MLNEDLQQLVSSYLNPNNQIRLNAEKQLNTLLLRGDPNDLNFLFNSLNNPLYNNDIKLFLSLLIKKIFDTCINESNITKYQSYIQMRKGDIINTILNLNTNLKVINILVISLYKAIELFYSVDKDTYSCIKEANSFQGLLFRDVFEYIVSFYNKQKLIQNNDHRLTFQSLFISFHLLKLIYKNNVRLEGIGIADCFKLFNDQIITDYKILTDIFGSQKQSQSGFPLEVTIQYLRLYLQISKYSLNLLRKDQREQLMNITYSLVNSLLNVILNNNDLSLKSNNQLSYSKYYFDCIFLCNKILIKYTGYVAKIDLITIKKYSELFYIYISNKNIFLTICNLLKTSGESTGNDNPEYKQSKFIINIIDFFRELLQLISLSNWGDLVIFKDCYSEECIKISDYLSQEFFTDERMKELLLFSIQHCLTFKVEEINMAINDVEEFYTWYDGLSPMVDLREKAVILCRIIYERYKKNMREFINTLENELVNIIQKEKALTQSNTNSTLSFEEINLKCALLSFFETTAVYHFNKKTDYDKWVNIILLSQLNLNLINAKGSEMFSKFIIIRILTVIIEYKELQPYKGKIFSTITNIFFNSNTENIRKLLSLASIDFFFAFFDDIMPIEFPLNFFQNYIYKICELLKNTSNPDIHSKTIKSTQTIINQSSDEDICASFSLIFPILKYLWDNNWNEYVKQFQIKNEAKANKIQVQSQNKKITNEIEKVRQNLIQLISIFVKRVGLFVDIQSIKGNSIQNNHINIDKVYFEFIYNLIGYSINIKSNESSSLVSEAFRLILFIQDEYFESSIMKTNQSFKDLLTPIENGCIFPYYLKVYDYLPIILDNLYFGNDYIIIQLFIIEQLISLSSIEMISNILIQCQFIDKVIFILNKLQDSQALNDYHQIIFNFMEYLLYVINSYSKLPSMQVTQYNNFIYQFIANTFNKIGEDTIASIKHNEEEPLLDQVPLSIFIGGIQLANRLLYVNMKNNMISIDYTLHISNKVRVVLMNKDLIELMTSVQTDIIDKSLVILNNILLAHKGQISLRNNNDISIGSFITNEYSIRSKSHYLNKHDKILSNWLYFFNKMNNQSYYYNLSASEDKMRLMWSSKFEKCLIGDFSNIEFKLKYYFLLNDDINTLE